MPQFNYHFVGLRYSFRSFNTVLSSDRSQFSDDFYQTMELWGGLKIRNRFQILGFIPFNINHASTDDGERNQQGLGDVTVFGTYTLFDKRSLTKDTQTVGQQLWFGAGLKLPTGQFSLDTSELVSSANFQPGSGSIDFMLTATYLMVVEHWSLIGNATYRINQAASTYHFGNRFTTNAYISHSYRLNRVKISPDLGVLYEHLQPNTLDKENIADTGGYALLGSAGFEANIDNVTIGINAQFPVKQDFSNSQTKTKMRGLVHLTYAF